MYFVKGRNADLQARNIYFSIPLALGLLVAAVAPPTALAQGMMEYGGLMAMPKGVPGGDTIKNMTRSYGTVPNAISGQTATNVPPGITMTMPDGSIAVDQKKAAVFAAKADADYKQAKKILDNKAAQNPANLRQAEKLFRDAISIRNSIWGYADPTIPKLLVMLGQVYELLKQPATAESCYQNSLVYINKKFGTGSAERLDTFERLAPLLVKQNKLSDALSLQQQITLMKERKVGATDASTIEARLTWANTAKALDKPNTPDIYKQCLTDIDAAGTKLSPEKIAKYRSEIIPNYLETLKKQGREEEAKAAESSLTAAAPTAPSTAPAGAPTTASASPGTQAAPATPTSPTQPATPAPATK
ncbi:MAG: tetratricopeptide repeat protein [Cyanobacteria bacterium SZAS TMP-1]|nr:tetratricopeptide repeat protein [Cyanobacteria bacterium SZAS TMP-1]